MQWTVWCCLCESHTARLSAWDCQRVIDSVNRCLWWSRLVNMQMLNCFNQCSSRFISAVYLSGCFDWSSSKQTTLVAEFSMSLIMRPNRFSWFWPIAFENVMTTLWSMNLIYQLICRRSSTGPAIELLGETVRPEAACKLNLVIYIKVTLFIWTLDCEPDHKSLISCVHYTINRRNQVDTTKWQKTGCSLNHLTELREPPRHKNDR